jgi:hypothetical protein
MRKWYSVNPTIVELTWKLRGTSVELWRRQNGTYLFVYLALIKKAWKVELIFEKVFLFILHPLEKRNAAGAAA